MEKSLDRKSSHPEFDAVLDWEFHSNGMPKAAYLLVKFTYHFDHRTMERTAPVPLMRDLRDPNLSAQLAPGSDFWTNRRATDVILEGAACPAAGHAVPQMTVALHVGHKKKEVAVFGKRFVEWTSSGNPRLGWIEPFERMSLNYANSYGGFDSRVKFQEPNDEYELLNLMVTNPGFYPRNPFGKGFLVGNERIDDIELPNLENPNDLLTDERLLVRTPADWHQQPLPWCYEWLHPIMFPRSVLLDMKPRFQPPHPEQLAEVTQGFLDPRHLQHQEAEKWWSSEVPAEWYQESSLGMSFTDLTAGTPIRMVGMNEKISELSLTIPEPPQLTITMKNKTQAVLPQLMNVCLLPSENSCQFVYCAKTQPGSAPTFFPGIQTPPHLSATVNGREQVMYSPVQ
jgi:hypothetical protein